MSGLPHVLCVVCHCVRACACVCPQVVCQVLKAPIPFFLPHYFSALHLLCYDLT